MAIPFIPRLIFILVRFAVLLIPQVYKSHLTEGRAPSGPAVDSARQNLASTFVNAFVNAGFGQDKLMTVVPEGEGTAENVHWIFKNKVGHPTILPC